jgi:hypothetical protein
MSSSGNDDGLFGPLPTRDQLVSMIELLYENIVATRDDIAMLRTERIEDAEALSELHREDLDRFAHDIERLWVEAYAIGRRTGFVLPPPPPGDDPGPSRH